jgi:hypothetical protein
MNYLRQNKNFKKSVNFITKNLFCKGTSVRGNKMAEMSLGTNGNPGV